MSKSKRRQPHKTDIELLCRLMEQHGLSQNGVARELGLDPATINRLVQQREEAERAGNNILSRRIISQAADYFKLPVKQFFPELKR